MKKLLVWLLCAISCFSAVACGGPTSGNGDSANGGSVNSGNANVKVWTAGGTEKILQGVDYSSRHDEKTLEIGVFKNENEAGQIILTTDNDVNAYTVETADLTSASGDVLKKESFTLFNQKYIFVSTIKDFSSGLPTGNYPDALLPYEKAVEYGENAIKGGNNQGIWVNVKPNEDQKAGVYTGNFKVSCDGKNFNVPVKVEVYDYALSNVTHSKSSFMLMADEIAWAELDSTVEIQEKYYDFMLDHRINPQHLPGNDMSYVTLEGKSLEVFLDYAVKYAKDDRCSSYNIPFNTTIVSATVNGKYQSFEAVEPKLFVSTLTAMAQRSVEEGVNLFKKATTYFIFFDEYNLNGKADQATYNLDWAHETCESLAQTLKSELNAQDAAFKAELLNDLANIKHKCVGSLTEELTAEKALIIPTIDKYHEETLRNEYIAYGENSYGENDERWWYTCCLPYNPYPTYHIDDHLISSRLLSWMMYDYGVVGNLFWDAAMYSYRKSAFGDLQLMDYYGTALRYPDANGDGFLLYPGRQYGIDGPVASIRLKSIADGNEDYDLHYALNELYAENGVSDVNFAKVLDLLQSNLYTGTMVQYNTDVNANFVESRKSLAQLLVCADKLGLVVDGVDKADGKVTVTLSAPKGVSVLSDGKEISGVDNGERTVFTVEKQLNEEVNTLNISAKSGDTQCSLSINLGGRMISFDGSELNDKVSFLLAGGNAEKTTVDGQNVLKLNFNANAEQARQTANIDVTSLEITSKVKTVTINIYSYEDAQITMAIAKKGSDGAFTEIVTYQLNKGWNEIEIPSIALNVKDGVLDILRLNLKDRTAQTSIAIGEIKVEG